MTFARHPPPPALPALQGSPPGGGARAAAPDQPAGCRTQQGCAPGRSEGWTTGLHGRLFKRLLDRIKRHRPPLATALLALVLAGPALAAPPAPSRPVSGLPSPAQVKAGWQSSEARLLDRHGVLLEELRADPKVRRTDWTPLAQVSPSLLAAVLRAEDKRFFQHGGVDWLAAGKAALTNWLRDRPRGASTITMQLAGLLDAQYRARGARRDVAEKWRQMGAAGELEKTWHKEDILEAYLNLVHFRGDLVGVDAAARGLFDKRPAGLGPGESLILAALIRSPGAKPADVARRACALADDLPQAPDCKSLTQLTLSSLTGRYPIVPAARLAPHLAQRFPLKAGARHRTSLDADLQRAVTDILRDQLTRLAGRDTRDAAALVVDNASGEVLAYTTVSGPGSSSPESDGVRAERQAGSTLKPFLYGLAIENGLLTAASPLEDSPLSLPTGAGQYVPQNYDQEFRGLASVRVALASSLNIPAVRTLQLAGLDPFAERLGELGFRGLTEAADWYGYSLALGTLDTSLEELVNAYRTLANGGMATPLAYTPAAPGAKPPPGKRVFRPETAFIIGDILADRQARATTFGLENPLARRDWSAVKTGTSKDMRDNWCIGWSSRYTVGVWVGNFDGAPMHDVSGISGAAPAWAAILDRLHAGHPSTAPRPPRGLTRQRIEPPGEAPRQEWFLPGSEPDGTEWLAARPPAQIVNPAPDSILALDPDIPAAARALRLQARNTPPGARWTLDGQPLEGDYWTPTRGRHDLTLHDADGRELDRVKVEVR